MKMDKKQKKLKDARAEIEAVLKRYDIAGFVSLHGEDWGEVFWNIWPSYSILSGDFPSIRIKSKLAEYGGNSTKQQYDQAQTAQMIRHLALTTGNCAMQFLDLSNIIDSKVGAVHSDTDFIPDPSKMNPENH